VQQRQRKKFLKINYFQEKTCILLSLRLNKYLSASGRGGPLNLHQWIKFFKFVILLESVSKVLCLSRQCQAVPGPAGFSYSDPWFKKEYCFHLHTNQIREKVKSWVTVLMCSKFKIYWVGAFFQLQEVDTFKSRWIVN